MFAKSALLLSVNLFYCISFVFDFTSAELVALSAAALSKCLLFFFAMIEVTVLAMLCIFCNLVVPSVSSNLHCTLDSFDLFDFGTLH